MNRNERIHKIDDMLARHGTVPVDLFLSTLKISLATFKRDLDYLRTSLHAPVIWDRSRGGYSYGKRKGKAAVSAVPALWCSGRDAHALLTAHAALSAIRSGGLKSEAEGLCARLLTLLSAHGDAPNQIARRLTVQGPATELTDHPLFAAVAHAVVKRRRLRLDCHVGRRRATQSLLVSPQHLTHGTQGWILDAFDHAQNRAIAISLSDCESLEVLNEKARDAALRVSGRAA